MNDEMSKSVKKAGNFLKMSKKCQINVRKRETVDVCQNFQKYGRKKYKELQ